MTDFQNVNPYRFVALDIDGTLINKEGEVPEKTRKAIEQLQKRGIIVTLATGRIWPSVICLVKSLQLRAPVILHNGALIREVGGKILYQNPLPAPLLQKIISLLEGWALDYLLCSLYEEEEQLFYPREPKHTWARSFLESYQEHSFLLEDFSLTGHTILRILVFGPRGGGEGLIKQLEEEELRILSFDGPRDSMYLEIFTAGCSKALGLEFLMKELHIQRDQLLVMGDNMNDLEMIQLAGCGVAMGTSPQILQDVADYVTLSAEEGGVGEALEQLILNERRWTTG